MTDLSKLSAKELREELKQREKALKQQREAYKLLVNENLPDLIKVLKSTSYILQDTKKFTFETLKTLLDFKCEAYDDKSDNQSHTFSDNKGNSITYGFRVIDNWDDTLSVGIAKVGKFLESLVKNEESAQLVSGIHRLLRKDSKGNLKANRVIELLKWAEEINDDTFTDAVNIIKNSYKPQRSAYFIEATHTDGQGKKRSIPLSITSVDFPEGTDIDALFPVNEKFL